MRWWALPTLLLLASPALAGGLTGTYFNYNNFTGATATQIDRVMNLEWSGKSPPAPGIRADGFSARWDGEIQTDQGGTYTFSIQTDAPLARVWIDGHLIVDGWHNLKRSEFTGSVDLLGSRKHGIRIDYDDSFGTNYLRLLWKTPGAENAVVVPECALFPLASSRNPIRINFGTSAKTQATVGYVCDLGAAFGDRGDGLHYGWETDRSSSVLVDVKAPSPDDRYSSFIPIDPSHRWEIAVPSGMYKVRLVAGGPESVGAVCNIDIEEKAALRNVTTKFNHWLDVTTRVVVTDGRLTITAAKGSKNAALCFVEIQRTDDSDRLLTWEQVGFSSDNKADRCTPPTLKRGGWRALFRENALPDIQQGSHRILLSNPFGTIPGEDMQLDQLIHAKEAGLDWIDRDFVATWKPVTQAGIEVIAYFGAANQDPDFVKLIDPKTGNKAWFDRFFKSIQPALDAGMSIALDGSVMMPDNSPLFEAIEKLRAMNVPVYVEARPTKQNLWAKNFPVICVDAFWHTSDPFVNDGAKPWAIPNDELNGEIIRFVQSPPPGKTWNDHSWYAPTIREILAEGDTAAISFDGFVRDGIDPFSLLMPAPKKP